MFSEFWLHALCVRLLRQQLVVCWPAACLPLCLYGLVSGQRAGRRGWVHTKSSSAVTRWLWKAGVCADSFHCLQLKCCITNPPPLHKRPTVAAAIYEWLFYLWFSQHIPMVLCALLQHVICSAQLIFTASNYNRNFTEQPNSYTAMQS